MRRTARVLASAALAGAAFCAASQAAFAGPAAEVSPHTVAPGGNVTVSVTCEPGGPPAPATLDATSQGFDERTVRLQRAPGKDDKGAPAVYRGTARVKSADAFEGGGPDPVTRDSAWSVDGTCPGAPGRPGKPWSTTFSVDRGDAKPCADPRGESCEGRPDHGGGKPCPGPRGEHCEGRPDHEAGKPCLGPPGDSCGIGQGHDGGRPCAGTWGERCEGGPDHEGGRPCAEPRGEHCEGDAVHHGVQAGTGGTFTDSVPALAAGGVLIAGAFGAAAHRLLRRNGSVGH
ncbi:hypothetical protein ELQ87_06550 [Streptomyces griseoviridis]|uniref:Secreted protein n=1 Tax=Streptomyces griseoviridis TaxID=45398 RepID=A0A3S9Z892_STRGD|nr:hypothetical protein [Streptomyces griseoviridis]AZS83996.1 hypothetical protein ELQ87_06550 [Streptomyces griseoviridis]QCN89151.1 hypothetical protein DDJ31_32805 [Streptomyces griseoviridis]